MRQSNIDTPRTLVVDDVRADLSEDLRRSGEVKEVILDLEVGAKWDEDGRGQRVRVIRSGGGSNTTDVHGERNREVEGVESRLVHDDETMPYRYALAVSREPKRCICRRNSPLQGELAQVNAVFRGSDEVKELTELGLVCSLRMDGQSAERLIDET